MKKIQTQASGSMHQKTDSVSFERDPSTIKSHAPKNLIIAPLNLNLINSNSNNYNAPEASIIKTRISASSQNTNNWDSQYNRLSNGIKELFIEMRKRTANEVSYLLKFV